VWFLRLLDSTMYSTTITICQQNIAPYTFGLAWWGLEQYGEDEETDSRNGVGIGRVMVIMEWGCG